MVASAALAGARRSPPLPPLRVAPPAACSASCSAKACSAACTLCPPATALPSVQCPQESNQGVPRGSGCSRARPGTRSPAGCSQGHLSGWSAELPPLPPPPPCMHGAAQPSPAIAAAAAAVAVSGAQAACIVHYIAAGTLQGQLDAEVLKVVGHYKAQSAGLLQVPAPVPMGTGASWRQHKFADGMPAHWLPAGPAPAAACQAGLNDVRHLRRQRRRCTGWRLTCGRPSTPSSSGAWRAGGI